MNKKDLLSYCWKHSLFGNVVTTDGKSVDISDPGLHNRNEGPTFFNAKVRFNNTLWVGNAQILVNSSDWYLNGFDRNHKYDNVILIICDIVDSEVTNSKGETIPIVQGIIPENVTRNCNTLMGLGGDFLCHSYVMEYSTTLMRHAWLSAMQTEWLEQKTEHLRQIYRQNKSMEDTFFISLFSSFGFGANDDVMEELANAVPMSVIDHYRDDLFQIEAIILGQAGLITDIECVPEKFHDKTLMEGYFQRLRNEYLYLAHKYSMKPISARFKPFNRRFSSPHVYLSMLANLIYRRSISSSIVTGLASAKEVMDQLFTKATPYWEMHNQFGAITTKTEKKLSFDKMSYIMAASIVPFLFFYGREKSNEEICDRAFDIMEQMKVFSTAESSSFAKHGLEPATAGDTIALTQMKREYCQKHDCLSCRFGFEFIRKH